MKRRLLSIITALALCLSLCPTWAFAAEGEPDTGLCPHHQEHIDCGYTAPTEGQPCNHEHTAECYILGVLPDADGSEYYEIGPDAQNMLDCQHSHDESCGYVQDDPGQPCGFACRICPIEDLIAALPDEVTADNAEDVRARLDGILALYTELAEEEQEQINLSRCYALQGALDEANTPMPLVTGDFDLFENKTVKLTAEDCGDNCLGHTITYKGTFPVLGAATILVESGNHNITFSNLNLTNANVGVMPGGTMNLTLTGENTIEADINKAGIYVPVGATLIIGGNGSLNVSGSENGAGIGGSYYVPDGNSTRGDTNCGEVIINSGTITAAGGYLSAGIGGACGDDNNPTGDGGTVTINGGSVTATGGRDEYVPDYIIIPGIGGSKDAENNGSLTLSSTDVLAKNTVLGPKGTYTINGDPTADMIVVPEGLVYSGEPLELGGKIYIDVTKTSTEYLFGQNFTVKASADGWVLQDLDEVVNAGTYTAIFEKDGKTISKDFTVAQSGTQFEGNLIVRNGATETTAFTVSDTITVIATPKAIGQAPANGAMLAADFSAPGESQMALYVGDTQVSRAVDAVDGSYTMEASAADVLKAAPAGADGKSTLIVKFVGNNNMANAEAQVQVTVTPNPLTAEMVTLDTESVTYNGQEQKPTVTVSGLTDGEDYEVTFQGDFQNARNHTVTVTGKGIYAGTVAKTFTIGKATPTITWENDTVELTYTGKPANIKPIVTLVNGETYNGEIIYHYGGDNHSDMPVNVGAYADVKAGIPEQDNYIAAESGLLHLTILPADQAAPAAPTATDENIKDTNITLTAIENAEYSMDGTTWQSEPIFTGLKPNQQYTFYARLKGDDNHNPSPASAGTDITTKKTMLDNATVTLLGKYTYNGTAQTPEMDVVVMLNEEVVGAGHYTSSFINNINAGTATVTITASADGDYSGSASTTFLIRQAPLTIKANDQTITYGNSITPGAEQATATGLCTGDTLSGITLTPSSDQVSVENKTITPSAAQIKNGSGVDVTANYEITYQTGALTINQSTPTIEFVNGYSLDKEYDGQTIANPTADALTITGALFKDVVFEWNATPLNVGTYTLTATIPETTNTAEAEATLTVTISKATYTGTTTVSTSGKYGMTKTYELKDLLPEGYVLGEITTSDSSGIFEDVPSVDGTTLTYKLVDDQNKVNEIGEITIPVTSSTNYNAFSLTVKVTVTNVLIPTLTVNPIQMTYTGSPVPNERISGTAIVDGTAITGKWSFVSGQNITNVADSGTKQVTFKPDSAEFGSNTGTVVVTITKATPSMTLTPSSATMPNGGTVTLTLSGLPAGGSATVTCSNGSISVAKGSGNTWTAELPSGGGSYTFTASYAGDGNHTSATAACTVSVEKIKPTLALSASPTSLIGGGKVTLTLTGLPTGGTATVSCSDSSITVTAGAGNTWTATLPNGTATYTFTASYDGSASCYPASASCTVETKKIALLPDPPTGENGEEFQLVMEEGISEVPEGLKGVPGLETVEKLETVMKTAITQANTGIPQANTAVYDVTLMISKDGGTTWEKATAANFPASGNLTVTLPYPAGTDSSYQFTVVHMFTTTDFGKTPGKTETPKVSNTSKGIRFVVTGLSPISVGWTKASTPTNPTGPTGGGGGSYVSTYAVTVEKSEHGKVTSNRNNAASGSTVTLTVTPDSGYVLDTLTVTDSRGNTLKLTDKSNGKYTFTMPSRAVTVKATFVPLPDDVDKPCDGGADCPSRGFTDLGTVGTWYHEAVDYVLRNGLMGGYSSTMFGPNDNLTRAQFAQILFNKEGRPGVNYLLQYSDVAAGTWYTEAIRWATSQGVVGGYGDGRFGPNDNITREQLAVMLWRYAGSPAATNKELHFADVDKISGYALEALRWAVENGIINGYDDGRLGPDGLATRAQVAQMLMNFLKDE